MARPTSPRASGSVFPSSRVISRATLSARDSRDLRGLEENLAALGRRHRRPLRLRRSRRLYRLARIARVTARIDRDDFVDVRRIPGLERLARGGPDPLAADETSHVRHDTRRAH